MSVLIRGMDEIPEDGAVLVVKHDNGKAYIKHACTYGYSMELVKIPEKHGRLIDEDDIDIPSLETSYDQVLTYKAIRESPTIIEAEGAEE